MIHRLSQQIYSKGIWSPRTVVLARTSFHNASTSEAINRHPSFNRKKLIYVAITGSFLSGFVGFYLWRFRWCEGRLQGFAADDGDQRPVHGIANRCALVSERALQDAEMLRKHLNERPNGVTYVESSKSSLSEDFARSALAPRPCVVYITIDNCQANRPHALVKHIAKQFGAYTTVVYFMIRELFHVGPMLEESLLDSLQSILSIVGSSLQRLKEEHGHSYYPPVVAISGLEHIWGGAESTTESQRLVQLATQSFLDFCSDMSRKGLLHVVIPQRVGSSILNYRHSVSVPNANSDKIFVVRPMNKEESYMYLFGNIFTSFSSVPDDTPKRIAVFESGSSLRARLVTLQKSFHRDYPAQSSVLNTIAEFLHTDQFSLNRYVDIVRYRAMRKALAANPLSVDTQSVDGSAEMESDHTKFSTESSIFDVITPELLYDAYEEFLTEQYERVAAAVMSSFLCGDDERNTLLCYQREEQATNVLKNVQKRKMLFKKEPHTINNDNDNSKLHVDSQSVSSNLSSYEPSSVQLLNDGAEEYYDHLFDIKIGKETKLTNNKIMDNVSKKSEEILSIQESHIKPEIVNRLDNLNQNDSSSRKSIEPILNSRVLEKARRRISANAVVGLEDSKLLYKQLEIKNVAALKRNERIETLKRLTNALVELTHMPAPPANYGYGIGKNRERFDTITLWQFVHDHSRGQWSLLWYLLDEEIINISLPIDTASSYSDKNAGTPICFSQADAVHRYIIRFSSPIHRRIVETLIVDGGFNSLRESSNVKRKGPISHSLKNKAHRKLSARSGSINVHGYGIGHSLDAGDILNEMLPDSADNLKKKIGGAVGHYDGWAKRSEAIHHSLFGDRMMPSMFGSCDSIDQLTTDTNNTVQGTQIAACIAKLDAIFDGGKKSSNSGPLSFLGYLQQSLVRASAVQMGLCTGSYPRTNGAERTYQDKAAAMICKRNSSKGGSSGLRMIDKSMLAAFHLEHIANIHGGNCLMLVVNTPVNILIACGNDISCQHN